MRTSSPPLVKGGRVSFGCVAYGDGGLGDLRMLIDEGGGVVHFVVDDDVQVFLGAVKRNIGEGEFLGHGVCVLCGDVEEMCGEKTGQGRGMRTLSRQYLIGEKDGGFRRDLFGDSHDRSRIE
jgi:hypothetical protein